MHCIVVVDYFSGWVEIYPIENKAVITATNWLWGELIPCFGKAHWFLVGSR